MAKKYTFDDLLIALEEVEEEASEKFMEDYKRYKTSSTDLESKTFPKLSDFIFNAFTWHDTKRERFWSTMGTKLDILTKNRG